MASQSEELRQEFNRRLGRRSVIARNANRPRSARSQLAEQPRNIRSGAGRVIRQRISTGQQSLPSKVRKNFERVFGPQSTGGSKSPAGSFQKTMNNIVDETIETITRNIATEQAISEAMNNPPAGVKQDKPWYQSALQLGLENAFVPPLMVIDALRDDEKKAETQTEPVGLWKGLFQDFERSPAGRALDIVSRPAYGVAEGLDRALEAGYERGEGFWESWDDLVKGGWAGLSGQEKTGFGDVWHRMRESSDIAGMEQLRELEQTNPGATRWIDRAVGLGGELTMDPLNWVGLGAAGVITNTGEQLTESTARNAIRDIVDTIARDYYDDAVKPTGSLANKPSQQALATYAVNAAESAIEKNILEISSGTHAGWSKMGTEHLAQSTAQSVTEEVRTQVLKEFNRSMDVITNALKQGGNIPIRAWRSRLARSNELEDLVDDVMAEIRADAVAKGAKKIPARVSGSRDNFLTSLTKNDVHRLERSADRIRQGFDAEIIQYVTDEVYRQTKQLYYNTINIRVGSKNIPIRAVGRAYGAAKQMLPERFKTGAEDFAHAMSYERNFPGRLALISQQGRSIGAKAFEDFHAKWTKIARNFTQEQDKLLYQALQDPNIHLPPELEAIRKEIANELSFMWADEVAQGARSEANVFAENYAPVWTKGGKELDRKTFKDTRKKSVQTQGNTQGWTSEKAKAKGLKPVESAFESLLLRKLKSIRDLTRANFLKDLVENYGFMAKPLSGRAIRERNVVKISRNNLPQYMRKEMDKGFEFYLPRAHSDTFDQFKGLSDFNSRDAGRVIHQWSKLTNIIKYLSTVPRAGFHIRNMLGDFFMGLLDHVPSRTYKEVVDKWLQRSAGGGAAFRITSDITKSWDEMKALYDTHANSGFFETEIPLGGSTPSAGQHLSNVRKRTANAARNVSDLREDYGRFVHFIAAMRQEAAKFTKQGFTGARLEEKALEAAVWRVNQYKFDYGALTSMERKIKLLFPFYTFTRKSAPALLQQLFLNPKYMSLTNRFMEYNDGSAADGFNKYMLPDYVRDTGYGILNQEEEPLFMTADVLPTNTLNSLDFTNSQQFFQSVAQQMNPMAQLPFEMALGRQIFSERPTGSFPEYMLNKFSVPGQAARQFAPGGSDAPAWLQAISESWTGAGIPIRQFTEEQQAFGLRALEDFFIQDPFSEFNQSQDQINIYRSDRRDGSSFRVKNVATGEILFDTVNPREALELAKRVLGQ